VLPSYKSTMAITLVKTIELIAAFTSDAPLMITVEDEGAVT